MKRSVKKANALILATALLTSSMGVSEKSTVSAVGADVKLAKKSVSLTIQKTADGSEYGKVKVKVKKAKGVKIKKISCKLKKKGIVTVTAKGKQS